MGVYTCIYIISKKSHVSEPRAPSQNFENFIEYTPALFNISLE